MDSGLSAFAALRPPLGMTPSVYLCRTGRREAIFFSLPLSTEFPMAEITLYHAAPSRASIVRWMLEEIGEPYDIQLLSLSKEDNRAPAYLAINPMGKVPALRHGDVVITEAAAICTYLADEFPRAKLNIPVGDRRRGVYLKWLFFGRAALSRR